MGTTTAPTGFGRAIWAAIKGGNQVHGVGLVPVSFTMVQGHSSTFNRNLFMAGRASDVGSWKIEKAAISFGAAVNDDGSNYWSIMLQVGKESTFTDLGVDALVSLDDWDANSVYGLDIAGPEDDSPKKVFLEAGDIIRVNFSITGTTMQDLSSNNMTITLFMRHSPPGR